MIADLIPVKRELLERMRDFIADEFSTMDDMQDKYYKTTEKLLNEVADVLT